MLFASSISAELENGSSATTGLGALVRVQVAPSCVAQPTEETMSIVGLVTSWSCAPMVAWLSKVNPDIAVSATLFLPMCPLPSIAVCCQM